MDFPHGGAKEIWPETGEVALSNIRDWGGAVEEHLRDFDRLRTSLKTLTKEVGTDFGRPVDPINGNAVSASRFIWADPVADPCDLDQIKLFVKSPGQFKVFAAKKDGDVMTTKLLGQFSASTTGLQSFTASDFGKISFQAGEYIALKGPGLFTYRAGVPADGAGWWQVTTDVQSVGVPLTNIRLEAAIRVVSRDIYVTTERLQNVEDLARTGFQGKRIVVLGDSLSTTLYGGGYYPRLAEMLGADVVSYSAPGRNSADLVDVGITGLADRGTNNDGAVDYTDAAACLIMVGANADPGGAGDVAALPAQTVSDLPYVDGGTDYTTVHEHLDRFANDYVGNVACLLEYLQHTHPQMTLYLVVPPPSPGRAHLADRRDKLQAIGALYGVPVLDGYTESGVSPRVSTRFFEADRIHLNTMGNAVFAKWLARRMLST